MCRFLNAIVIFCFLFHNPIKGNCNDYVILNNIEQKSIAVDKYVYYLEDKNADITIDSLLTNPQRYKFKKAHEKGLNYGFYDCAVWLKITIDNQSTLNKDFIFTIDYALLNDVRFYETINGKLLRKITTGENYRFNSRNIENRAFTFHLNNFPLQKKTYYVRIYNDGETLRIPMEINSPVFDKELQNSSTMGLAIYYGYLLFSLLLNILLLFSFKKRQYLYFGGFVLTFGLFIFIGDGYAFQYLWPESPWLANHSIIIITAIINFFMLAFTRDFLNFTGKLKRTSNVLFAIFAIFFLLSFTNYPFYRYIVFFANTITAVMIVFISCISIYYVKKKKSAYHLVFLLAFFFVMTGTFTHIFKNLGIIPVNFLTQYAIKFGFILQIVVLTFALIMKFKIDLTDINITLEREVNERTAEICAQRDELSRHNLKIEQQSKEITDSIIYAKRIQSAILPENNKFDAYFKDHFIYFKPKNIVSGDFYWFAEKNSKKYIAVADCTGHGVPGAFLSMLGISFLNEIINKDIVLSPNLILNELQRLILKTLSTKMEDGMATRDGMDISICALDFVKNTFEYAGANNPLFLIRDGELEELKTDKMPIGLHIRNDRHFANHIIELKGNDRIYLFSDGYMDQFNSNYKRFSKVRFKNLISGIHNLPFDEQKTILQNTIENWQVDSEQIDDMLIVGFSV